VNKLFIIIISSFLMLSTTMLSETVYSIDWSNKAGLDKNGEDEKNFLWISLNDPVYEVGVFNYAGQPLAYGGLDYSNESMELQAGYVRRSILNGFIVSHGEYLPDDVSTPDKKPVGYSLKIKNNSLYFLHGSYFHRDAGNFNNINVDIAAINFQISKWRIETGGAILTMPMISPDKLLKDKNTEALDPGGFFSVDYDEFFKGQVFFSPRYGRLGRFNFLMKDIFLDLYIMSVKTENPFAALLYNINRTYYVSLRNSYFKFRVYDLDNLVHSKAAVKVDNFGLYNYISDKSNLVGVFYRAENKGLSPYLAVYTTPGADVTMTSCGLNYNDEWMFAIVRSANKTGNYFPFDEQVIPDRFYYSGVSLDAQNGFSHSYFGFQFYWNSEPLFCYISVLQNYAEKQDDNIAVTVRLEYTKSF
jgi:hypothetical protein